MSVSLLLALCVLSFSGKAIAQNARLLQADKVHMLQSKDGSNKPFFRIRLSIPEGIPKLSSPTNSIEILEDDQVYKPFYVKLGRETVGVPATAKTSRFVLLLFDVSGSMLERLASSQTKFEAARAAAKQFLNGFEPGVDNVAVVPFESRQVVSRIQAGVFATDIQSVQAEIDTLPRPDRKGNTGLYTAIATGLEILNARKNENISRSAMLLVLTDGKNDVHPDKGDDQGLLHGEAGLMKVAAAARTSGFTVVTIGFGDSTSSIDPASLQKIASPEHYWSAQNLQTLEQIFRKEQRALINQFDVAFVTGSSDNRMLMGRDIQFKVRMKADDGRLFESDPIAFATPETSAPPFSGLLTADEEEAWMRRAVDLRRKEEILTIQDLVLSRLMIMVGLGLCLAVLWFGLPRLIWPESYLRSAAASYANAAQSRIAQRVASPLLNIPRPGTPRAGTPRPSAASTQGPSQMPDPSVTMSESRVTIRPGSGPIAPARAGAPKLSPKPRRAVDETIVTGAQPPADTDPWRLDPLPDPPSKRQKS